MLGRQNLGGCQKYRLPPSVHHGQHRSKGYQGLTTANFALQESVHRMCRGQIRPKLLSDLSLACGQREWQ